MNILALDLGTSTGWACLRSGKMEHGTLSLARRVGDSHGMRFLSFRKWLENFRDMQLFVYEAPHHRGGAATKLAVGYASRVDEIAAELGVECTSVHSLTLKKWVTGQGRADKDKMRAHAISNGWVTNDVPEDEMEATCLLHYAVAEIAPIEIPIDVVSSRLKARP